MSTILEEVDVVILDPQAIDLVEVLVNALTAAVSDHARVVLVGGELVGIVGSKREASFGFTTVARSRAPARMACTKAEP